MLLHFRRSFRAAKVGVRHCLQKTLLLRRNIMPWLATQSELRHPPIVAVRLFPLLAKRILLRHEAILSVPVADYCERLLGALKVLAAAHRAGNAAAPLGEVPHDVICSTLGAHAGGQCPCDASLPQRPDRVPPL